MKTEDGAVCQVYLNEYNPFIGNAAYLPLTSGKLQAYALTCDDIAKQYQFMPYLFHIDTPIAILNQLTSKRHFLLPYGTNSCAFMLLGK